MKRLFLIALFLPLTAHAYMIVPTVNQHQQRVDDRRGVGYSSAVHFSSSMAHPDVQFTSSTPFSQPHSNAGWLWRHTPFVDHTHDDCDYARRDCPAAK